MKDYKLQEKINKISRLKQYRKKSPKQLEKIALRLLEKDKFKVDWVGLSKIEAKNADKIYYSYISNYHIDSFNDLEDLKTLVYNTILENRIKEKIYNLSKGENSEIPNKYIMDSLTSLQKQNLDLKQKLGLNNEKKEGWLDFWTRFMKKLNKHASENRGVFTFRCPDKNCGKLALLVKKIDDYNTFQWSCFRGTKIYNETVMELIDEKKINFKRAAKIYGVSSEYMQGMYENIYLKEKKQ